MSRSKIFAMVGGISRGSLNLKLFGFVKEEAGDRLEFDLFDIKSLPYISQDIEDDPPAEVTDLRKRIAAADGVLIVTPEYNRSFPGVLKNALDWGSRPYGRNAWAGKPTGLIGTSPGIIGTFGAQSQIKSVLSFLDMRLMNQPEFYFRFPEKLDGGKLPAQSREFVKLYAEKFAEWVGKHKR
jgi:chromate reductase